MNLKEKLYIKKGTQGSVHRWDSSEITGMVMRSQDDTLRSQGGFWCLRIQFWDIRAVLRSQNQPEIWERYSELSEVSLRSQSVTLRSQIIPWDLRKIPVISEQYPEISEASLRSQSATMRSQNQPEISDRYPEISEAFMRSQSVALRSMNMRSQNLWILRSDFVTKSPGEQSFVVYMNVSY